MNMVLGDLIGAVTGVVNPIVKPLTQPFKEMENLTNELYDDNDDLMELNRHHSRSASLTSTKETAPEIKKETLDNPLLNNINNNLDNILISVDKLEKIIQSTMSSRNMNVMGFAAMIAMGEVVRIEVDKIKKDVSLLNSEKEEGEANGC